MGELIMSRLEDQILETLLHEALDGVVAKVSGHKGFQQSFTRIYRSNQLGNELNSWLIDQAGVQTNIDKLEVDQLGNRTIC